MGLQVFNMQHPRQLRTEYSVLLRTIQLFLRKHFFQAPRSGHFKKPSNALIKESVLDSVPVSVFKLIFQLVGIMGIIEAVRVIFS